MNKHTISDLYQMQSLPLSAKIRMTENRIRAWYEHFNGQVYASFSGGKDSTVLVDIITNMGYTDIPLVFVDTGLEYPEIREFVKGYGDRVTWLRPKMNFKQVIETYGYPFFSKEIGETVHGARKYLKKYSERDEAEDYSDTTYFPNAQHMAEILGIRGMKDHKEEMTAKVEQVLKDFSEKNNAKYKFFGINGYLLMLLGEYPHTENGKITGEKSTMFNRSKYRFMLEAPFEITGKGCCNIMKKNPVHKFSKETGRMPITAQMASESRLRTSSWLKNGCNGFEMKSPISNPMSFWTEQDVLLYIKQNNLPICSVYGEVIEDLEGTEEVEGQMTMSDVAGWEDQALFDAERRPLKTTGCNRTGCMFCGFGCHLEKGEGRFERMKKTHPKQYDYIMRPWEEGGLNYKKVIDWINENGKMNIKY